MNEQINSFSIKNSHAEWKMTIKAQPKYTFVQKVSNFFNNICLGRFSQNSQYTIYKTVEQNIEDESIKYNLIELQDYPNKTTEKDIKQNKTIEKDIKQISSCELIEFKSNSKSIEIRSMKYNDIKNKK